MYKGTLIQAVKLIQLIAQQWSDLLSVSELPVNPAFAKA